MQELNEIKGIGINTIKDLNNLGIYNAIDLVTHYPFRYEVYEKSDLNTLKDEDRIVIDGIVENIPSVFHFSRVKNKMTFRLNVGTKILTVTIFNRAYFKSHLAVGTTVTIIGKYDMKHNSVVASNIRLGSLDKMEIEPVYHCSARTNSKKLNKLINNALGKTTVSDYIPKILSEKYKFIDKNKAIYLAHNPTDKMQLKKAINRLKYEELFEFMAKISYLKKNHVSDNGLTRNVDYQTVLDLIETFPFKLTSDQL